MQNFPGASRDLAQFLVLASSMRPESKDDSSSNQAPLLALPRNRLAGSEPSKQARSSTARSMITNSKPDDQSSNTQIESDELSMSSSDEALESIESSLNWPWPPQSRFEKLEEVDLQLESDLKKSRKRKGLECTGSSSHAPLKRQASSLGLDDSELSLGPGDPYVVRSSKSKRRHH